MRLFSASAHNIVDTPTVVEIFNSLDTLLVCPLGFPVLEVASVEIGTLSPYAHELHYSGERCADDCPACRWIAEQELQSTLAVLSSPDFPQLLKLAIDRALTRVIVQPSDEKEENHASLVAHSR